MSRAVEGMKSEALRAALRAVVESHSLSAKAQSSAPYEALAALLAKHGGLPGLRPNLKLAAAFGAEVAQLSVPQLGGLLDLLAADSAAPDTARVFLPVAAAHGYAQRIVSGHSDERAWRGLQLLVADERSPVRMGAVDALSLLAAREGGVDALIEHAQRWLEEPDRELSYGAVAGALEVLSDGRLIASVREHTALHALLSPVIEAMADAPRSAYRSDGRKRVLRSLPAALANLVASSRAGHGSTAWFRAECERARDPELRAVLSQALLRMAELRNAPARALIDELRQALVGSQKPLRDAARVRPGTGRGRRSRNLR